MIFRPAFVEDVKATRGILDEFLKAVESGRPFHVEMCFGTNRWARISDPSFMVGYTYRIVYEPAEVYACRYPDGRIACFHPNHPLTPLAGCTVVKFVEKV